MRARHVTSRHLPFLRARRPRSRYSRFFTKNLLCTPFAQIDVAVNRADRYSLDRKQNASNNTVIMEILRTIALYVEDKQMPFVVIGGHAVNAYGISRQTGDIDLLVQLGQKQKWAALFEKLHFEIGQNDERFARFRPESLGGWPIDLMFVDDSTFEKLYIDSSPMLVGVATVRVVSARHLATLKIHALKYFQEHRYAKDLSDLVSLLRSGKTGITKPVLRELCKLYASPELFEKIEGDCP